jgi:hypothetical protein
MYLFICFCYGFPLMGIRSINRFRQDYRGVIRFPRSHWDLGIGFHGFNDTAESASVVSCETEESYTKTFISYPAASVKPRIQSLGHNETAESDPVVSLNPNLQTIILKNLANSSRLRNSFSRWIRALEGIVMTKTEGRKSCGTVSFNI